MAANLSSHSPPQSTTLHLGFVDVGVPVRIGLFATPAGPVTLQLPDRDLLVVHAGRPIGGISRCDGRAVRRVHLRGDIDIVPAGCVAGWEDDEPSAVLTISLPRTLMEATARELDIDESKSTISPELYGRDPRIEHIAWALQAELEEGAIEQSLYAKQLISALAIRMLRREGVGKESATLARQRLSTGQLQRVHGHIEREIASNLSLTELASVASLSVSHFTQLFKNTTGKSVHQYVIERRVEQAKSLLARGDLSIADVALETGFAHQSHMARCMRRVLGVAPTSFGPRRRGRNDRVRAR